MAIGGLSVMKYIVVGMKRSGGQVYLTPHGSWCRDKDVTAQNLATFDSEQEAKDALDRSDEMSSAWVMRLQDDGRLVQELDQQEREKNATPPRP